MFHRTSWSPHAPRFVLSVLAVVWLVEAVGTSQLPYVTFGPWVWALFYVLAAGCGMWAAFDFANPRAIAFAGASAVVANLMRGGLLLSGWLTRDPALSHFGGWALASGVTTWWGLAFVTSVLFFRRVAPLASVERVRT